MHKIRQKIAGRSHAKAVVLLLCLCLPLCIQAQYSLKGWGLSYYGELGNGSSGLFNGHPVTVIDDGTRYGGEFVFITASDRSLAIKADGSLWGCGNNQNGRIGDGTTTDRNVFTLVDSGLDIGGKWIYVHAGFNHNFGVKEDGSLWAWGEGGTGAMGNGGTGNSLFPINISPGAGSPDGRWIKAVAFSHSAGIREDGTLWTWGNANNYGQLGNGTGTGGQLVPTKVHEGGGAHGKWVDIAIGSYHNIALREDGSLWSWGSNDHGKLGLGTSGAGTHQIAPTLVDDGTGQGGKWILINATGNVNFGIKEDGSLWGWGQNGSGQVGNGTTTDRNVPTLVDAGAGSGGRWISVSTGGAHTIGVKEDGSIWVWGDNSLSQLDGSTTTSRLTPFHLTTVGNTTNAVVEAGDAHTFLINDPPQPCQIPAGLAVRSITSSDVAAFWSQVAGMIEYDIAIDQSPTAEPDPFTAILQTTDTFHAFANLDPGARYFVHVRTHCGANRYSHWDSLSFFTLPFCEPPFWIAADDVTQTTADISWDPVVIGTAYVVAIDQSATSVPDPLTMTDTVSATIFNAENLEPGTRYYAHIRTICAEDNYAAWDTVSFVTEEEDVSIRNDHRDYGLAIKIYPNPVTSILHFRSPVVLHASISGVDGKLLMTADHVKSVDVSKLPAGIYLLELSNGYNGVRETIRFVKRE